jgi:hypothetical protein
MTLAAAVLAGAAATFAAAPSPAQSPGQKDLPRAERTFNLTLEQRHTIKEIIKEEKIEKAPADAKIAAGETVPAGVTLHDMPTLVAQKVPQIKSHQFFVAGEKIAIVEPKDRRIAEVIE